MPLIQCPECGMEISDRVKACPHCGYPFETIEETKTDVKQVEIASMNITPKKPNTKRLILIGVFTAVAIVAIGLLVSNFLGVKKYNSYIDNLDLAMITMLDGGSDAEALLNLTAKVWINTIYEEFDPETDKYTRGDFGFHDDFNTSLDSLFADSITKSKIFNIESNQDLVKFIMKELQSPPKGLENCYNTVTELYSTYKGLTNLAINPSGSYNSFTDNKSEKINAFLVLFDKLEAQIPEKK